jgi:hypothetical protein
MNNTKKEKDMYDDDSTVALAFTVFYDRDSGEIERVDLSPEFQEESELLKADVFLDCRDFIEEQRGQAFSDFYQEAISGVEEKNEKANKQT